MTVFFHLIQCFQDWSMFQCVSVLLSFLWPNDIPSYRYTTLCLSIQQLMDIWVVSAFWLLWIILLWIFACKFLCGHMFSFLLGIELEVEWLGQMVTWGLFSRVAVPFYILTSNVQEFQFLHILNTTCFSFFLFSIIAILVGWTGISLCVFFFVCLFVLFLGSMF